MNIGRCVLTAVHTVHEVCSVLTAIHTVHEVCSVLTAVHTVHAVFTIHTFYDYCNASGPVSCIGGTKYPHCIVLYCST